MSDIQYSGPIGPLPLSMGGGNIIPASSATAISVNKSFFPIWLLPIVGAVALIVLASTRYYKVAYVLVIGMIGYWLLNK
jgi:hypothetical protein